MEKRVITISREFGSGGRTIGHMVAEKLGIPFYDKELVEHIALESGFSPKYIEEHGEHSPSKSLFSYAFAHQTVPGVMHGLSTADFLWNIQCNVILQLAEQGPCVIVGRNADYILKDHKDCLHAFIHASKEFRADRIVRLSTPISSAHFLASIKVANNFSRGTKGNISFGFSCVGRINKIPSLYFWTSNNLTYPVDGTI